MARACRHWALLLAATLLLPAASLAALDPTDVIQIQATTSLIRDNNLFRLPDVDPRLFGIDPANKADTARVLGVGIKVDKLVSRQRLIADVNLNETVYDKNDNLDFFGGDGRLAWLWQVGNYWSGEASFRTQRTLGGFSDFRQDVQDLIDTKTYFLAGGYQFHPRWRIGTEFTEQESTHSAAVRQSLDSESRSLGGEIRYLTPAQNSVTLQLRRTNRKFPNRVIVGAVSFDNGHTETRVGSLATWQLTGAAKIDGQVGRVDVQHDQLSQRNFSGIYWKAVGSLDVSSKLRLNLNLTKDVRLYEDITTSYILVNSFGISPAYALTAKLFLQSDLSFETRDFRGDPGFIVTNANRQDDVRIGRIGVTYTPERNVSLSLSFEAGDRRSNTSLNDYDYRSWLGTIRIGF